MGQGSRGWNFPPALKEVRLPYHLAEGERGVVGLECCQQFNNNNGVRLLIIPVGSTVYILMLCYLVCKIHS